MQRLTKKDVQELCSAIIIQAVNDYRDLIDREKKTGIAVDKVESKDSGTYGKEEIEEFFLGEWGETIIRDGFNLNMSGSDFLRAAKT